MNEYIEKYGQNAIQAYKKELRLSQSLQKDDSSPLKEQMHLLPKKSLSKRSLKPKKTQSQSKLNHSKSIRNFSKGDDEGRKKTSSFIQGSKKLAGTSAGLNNMFQTFNKGSVGQQGKKKLLIGQAVTPKNAGKFQFNLNLTKPHTKVPVQSIETKEKLTERIERSSGKKNIDKCSTSQTKYQYIIANKRSYLVQVQNRLQDLISSTKKGLKSLTTGIKDCIDLLLGNEEDVKLRKVFLLFKQLIERTCNLGQKYKSKYQRASDRIQSLQMIHHAYVSSDIHPSKTALQPSNLKQSKISTQIQTLILNQNYQLRKKIQKISQSASLMNVFGKFQQADKGKIGRVKLEKSPGGRESDIMSGNKMEKRRSSENLLYNSPNNNIGFYGGEKRLSFDPGLLSSSKNEGKGRVNGVSYWSMGQSGGKQVGVNPKREWENLNYHGSNGKEELQELSQEEDSSNEE